jgi:hypothetical protein
LITSVRRGRVKILENEGWLVFLGALMDCFYTLFLTSLVASTKEEDLLVLIFLGAFE